MTSSSSGAAPSGGWKPEDYEQLQKQIIDLRQAKYEAQEREKAVSRELSALKSGKSSSSSSKHPVSSFFSSASASSSTASTATATPRADPEEKRRLESEIKTLQEKCRAAQEDADQSRKKLATMMSGSTGNIANTTTTTPTPSPSSSSTNVMDLLMSASPGPTAGTLGQADGVVSAISYNEQARAELESLRVKLLELGESARRQQEAAEREISSARQREAQARQGAEKARVELQAAKKREEEAERRAQEEIQKTKAEVAKAQADLAEGSKAKEAAVAETRAALEAEQKAKVEAVASKEREMQERRMEAEVLLTKAREAAEQAVAKCARLGTVEEQLQKLQFEHSKLKDALAAAEAAGQERAASAATTKEEKDRLDAQVVELKQALDHEQSVSATLRQQVEQVSANVAKAGADAGATLKLLAERTSRCAALEGKCDELQSLHDKAQTAKEEACLQVQKLETQFAEANEAKATLERMLHSEKETTEYQGTRITVLEKSVQELKEDVEKAHSELTEHLERAGTSNKMREKEITALREQLTASESALSDLRQKNQDLVFVHERCGRDLEELRVTAAAELAQKSGVLEDRASKAEAALSVAETATAAKAARIAELEALLVKAASQEKELEASSAVLQNKLQEANGQLEQKTAKLSLVEAERTSLEERFTESSKKNDSLAIRLDEMRADQEHLEKKVLELETSLSGKNTQVSQLEETSAQLQGKLRDAAAEISAKAMALSEAETSLQEVRLQLAQSRKETVDINTRLDTVQKDLQSQVDWLKKEATANESAMATLKASMAKEELRSTSLESDLQAAKQQAGESNKQYDDARSQLAEMAVKAANAAAEETQDKKKIAELQEKQDDLNAQLQEHSRAAVEQEMKKDRQLVTELKGELQRYREYFASIGASPAPQGVKRATSSASLVASASAASATGQKIVISGSPEELKQALIKMSRDKFELETKCNRLEKDVAQIREELQNWKSDALAGYVGTHRAWASGAAAPAGPAASAQPSPRKAAGTAAGRTASTHRRTPSMSAPSLGKESQPRAAGFKGLLSKMGGGKQIPDEETFAERVQAVLEETLLKNVQLQKDMALLGAECDALIKHNRSLEKKLKEVGVPVPERTQAGSHPSTQAPTPGPIPSTEGQPVADKSPLIAPVACPAHARPGTSATPRAPSTPMAPETDDPLSPRKSLDPGFLRQ